MDHSNTRLVRYSDVDCTYLDAQYPENADIQPYLCLDIEWSAILILEHLITGTGYGTCPVASLDPFIVKKIFSLLLNGLG
jgi:hypothetical protein